MIRALRTILAIVVLTAFALLVRLGFGALDVAGSPGDRIDPLGIQFTQPPAALVRTGTSIGLLLLVAYLAGELARQLRLAAVTGYLAVGIVLGPSVLGVVRMDEVNYLRLVNDLAISLIALIAGGEIRLSFLRSRWKKVVTIASVEVLCVLFGASLVLPFVLNWAHVTNDVWSMATIALAAIGATIAVANSPAVVIAVIAETEQHSPMGRLALAVTICKDLVLVALFTVVLAIAAATMLESKDASASTVAGSIALHLGGSIVMGALVGAAMAWYMHAVRRHLGFFVVFTCFGIALVSEALHLEALIVAVVAGLLMQNIWPDEMEAFFEELEQISLPVYCVFFAVAGLRIELDSIVSIWQWAVLFVAVRGVLVWVSTWLGCRLAQAQPTEGRWLWTALTPQAGIALALASIAYEALHTSPAAEDFFGFLVAVIAINQLVGPVLFKFGLSRSPSAPASNEPSAAPQPPEPKAIPGEATDHRGDDASDPPPKALSDV